MTQKAAGKMNYRSFFLAFIVLYTATWAIKANKKEPDIGFESFKEIYILKLENQMSKKLN